MSRFSQLFRGIDPWIIVPTVVLLTTSCVVLFSIDHSTGGGDRAIKQIIFGLAGLVVIGILAQVRTQSLEVYGPWVYAGGVLLLLGVLIFGQTINGTTGWFLLGPISFQPVELVKIAFLWTLAWFFGRQSGSTTSWKPLIFSFLLLLGLVGLVLKQPDFGSAMMLVGMWLGTVLLVHRTRWHLAVVFMGFLVSIVVGWFFLNTIQRNRLLTFVQPDRDPLGAGYNVQQSVIATGSGEWFGRGLGLGPQSQLHFLPEQSTDFIFSVIAEELGFLGAGTMLVLFGIIVWRLHLLSRRASDPFSIYLAHGVMVYFLAQILINVGMNMGIAPVTGLPLPLVSSGGSSILASCLGLGLVFSSAKQRRQKSA